MEVKNEVKAIEVAMQCDCCKEGYMVRVEPRVVLTSCPPQFEHQCTYCGHRAIYFREYPHIEFEPMVETRRKGPENV